MDDDQAADFNAGTPGDEMPIAEAAQDALASKIAERRTDDDFQSRLKRRLAEDREVLDRLAL